MSKDHKELGKFILVLLILLASLIIVNNNMFPSMRNSDGDNSAYDMLVGNANQYFDDIVCQTVGISSLWVRLRSDDRNPSCCGLVYHVFPLRFGS